MAMKMTVIFHRPNVVPGILSFRTLGTLRWEPSWTDLVSFNAELNSWIIWWNCIRRELLMKACFAFVYDTNSVMYQRLKSVKCSLDINTFHWKTCYVWPEGFCLLWSCPSHSRCASMVSLASIWDLKRNINEKMLIFTLPPDFLHCCLH